MKLFRGGVNPAWDGYWQKQRKLNLQSLKSHDAWNIEELDHYARHGITRQGLEDNTKEVASGDEWENYLPSALSMYGSFRALEMQEKGVSCREWPEAIAAQSFASIYTAELISSWTHFKFPERFGGRVLRSMNIKMVPFCALGFLTGAKNQALDLARLQAKAFRKGHYLDSEHFPIFRFILEVICDFLGDPSFENEGGPIGETIFTELIKNWRDPDPNSLGPLLIAACDFHTYRCKPTRAEEFVEFDAGNWIRIPIEILLVAKLRQEIGLSTASIDHPLMENPFGSLPAEVGFMPDVLTRRVRDRMSADGFDETLILDQVLRP